MTAAVKECDKTGHCYYVFKDAWHVWGRWLLLGVLVAVLILFVPFSGYLMSRRRMSRGLPPIPGCGWMFPNPYKNTPAPGGEEPMVPRYRAHDELREYRRQNAMQQDPYASYPQDFETTDTTAQSYQSEEKYAVRA